MLTSDVNIINTDDYFAVICALNQTLKIMIAKDY